MDLAFEDRDIRRICEDKKTAIEKYGTFVAEVLQNRLADLRAATSLKDILVGEPALLIDSTFKINLIDWYTIVFTANNRRLSYDSQGNIDWSFITRIKILSIDQQNQKL